jgi:uncharacterized membrane protein YbhN (UPF0104 family)
MMLLAGRLGEQTATMVPEVVIAGATAAGDALLVVRDPGASISDDPKPLDDTTVEAWWAALGRLHDAGMAHGRIDPTRLTRRADGRAALVDWSTAEVAATDDTRRRDDAQLLTTTAIAIGTERALDHARRALGDQGVGATLPWLQEPALGRTLRRALDQSDLELDSLRAEAATLTGNDEPELVKLRRITWGSIAQMLVLGFAGWLFVSNLADIGLDTITSQLGDARVGWLVAALVVGQLPRLANAVSPLGAAPVALPFGPTAALEYAITFINLAVPSSIGRMATKLRFLQRQGVNVVGATTMSALDSVTQFAVQMLILFVGLGLGLTTLDLDIDLDRIDTGQIARIAALVVAALAVVVMAVPAVRSRVVPAFAELRSGLRVLRTPRKAAQLFFGNLGAELLFAVTLGVCLAAFGGSAALIDLMVVNTGVALFAGIMPVPGGIGVSEAALTAGLSALGVPEPTAFAVAITYRMCTFYLPPLWGYVALRWLRGRRYL